MRVQPVQWWAVTRAVWHNCVVVQSMCNSATTENWRPTKHTPMRWVRIASHYLHTHCTTSHRTYSEWVSFSLLITHTHTYTKYIAQTYISIPEHLREIESRNASMSYELETVLRAYSRNNRYISQMSSLPLSMTELK